MTTGISLVRENTESMQPPRSLWVTFPLGRPLGKPNDAEFQHTVIAASLDLINRNEGPVLEDFPQDIPALPADGLAACPVSFPQKSSDDDQSWATRLSQEFGILQPWYELSLRRREGRTLVGIAKETPQENIKALAALLDNSEFPTDVRWLKPAVEDLKAFYQEAMTAQPGEYDADAQQKLFWRDTTLGEAILTFYHHYQHAEDQGQKLIARILAPRDAVGAATGPSGETQ